MRYRALSFIFVSILFGCTHNKPIAPSAEQPSVAPAKEQPSAAAPAKKEPPAAEKAAITTESLLDDLTNLRRLAQLPSPSYTTRQASSYDRKSKSPQEGWFANGDAGQYIRVEDKAGRKEFVMMDEVGPGAIVRIWSANPKGNLRIYLDGSETPALEAPMNKLLGGGFEGIPKPLAGEYAKGWNLYFPIPYARHCKVTSDDGKFYYHVNYRTYEKGTNVKSFARDDLTRGAARISDAAKRLGFPREGGAPPADRKKTPFDVSVAPGSEAVLGELSGEQAICGFLVQLAADNIPAAARAAVLHMSFDGEATVECPIGDFFGTAPGLIAYESLPLGITQSKPQDQWCHWWMPFRKIARITVRNLGEQPVKITGGVSAVPYKWDDRSLLFHAKWRIQKDLPARPMTDWTHLQATGKGRFVGGALHVVNSVRDWWGEGDEKIYVDGEKFPSHFGTGSEDYYGYAWCCPERFVHAYHNQPSCQGPGNYGNTSVNRFHIIDDIPFTTAFKFDLENWHGSDKPEAKTARAAVSYWYARPGGTDFFKPIARQDVKLIDVPPYQIPSVAGAIEGEDMTIMQATGVTEPQELGDGYSNATHLWWREGKPNEALTLGFDAAVEGPKHVVVKLTKAGDYAKVQLYVNGQKAGDVIDLYHSGVIPSKEMDLGVFDLKKGRNTLTAQIVGANDAAVKAYMFGLDYIRLK